MPETSSLIVTTASDIVDANDNLTSLREAVAFANSNADASTITFDASLAGQTLGLTQGQIALSTEVTIDGDINGDDRADITLSGNNASRVFVVNNAASDVELRSLTITAGTAGDGGAIVQVAGSLLIADTTISDSRADSVGGALHSYYSKSLTVVNTTFTNNTAFNVGAVFVQDTATVSMANVTVTGNSSTQAPIWVTALDGNIDFNLSSSTIAENGSGAVVLATNYVGTITATLNNNVFATASRDGQVATIPRWRHPYCDGQQQFLSGRISPGEQQHPAPRCSRPWRPRRQWRHRADDAAARRQRADSGRRRGAAAR